MGFETVETLMVGSLFQNLVSTEFNAEATFFGKELEPWSPPTLGIADLSCSLMEGTHSNTTTVRTHFLATSLIQN